LRPRDTLLRAAATCSQHRPKALTDMNVQLANVIRDMSGVTGVAMIRARRAGARDPAPLAACKDSRIKATPHTIAKRLEGTWRDECLFTRRPSLARYDVDQQHIAAGDARLEAHLHTLDSKSEGHTNPAPTATRRPKNARRHQPHVDVRPTLYRRSGVDVTRLDGIEVRTAPTLMAEIGLDMSRWQTEQHFASWLG
jgi:hypothetical protein